MLTAQYHKTGIKQYMYIPIDEPIDNYANQLLQFHSVPKILQCEIKAINEQYYIYYLLKYKTTLRAVGEHLAFGEMIVRKIISSIIDVLNSSREYLLDVNHIIWSMDYIFIEADTGNLYFCYFPDVIPNNDITKFISELITLVGKKNENTVLLLLQFYNYITEPDCNNESLDEFRKKYLYEEEMPKEDNDVVEVYFNEEKEEKEKKTVFNNRMILDISIGMLALGNVIILALFICNILPYQYFPVLLVALGIFILVMIGSVFCKDNENPDEIMEEYFKETHAEKTFFNEDESLQTDEQTRERSNEECADCKQLTYGETSVLSADRQKEEPAEEMIKEDFSKELCLLPLRSGTYMPIKIKKNSMMIGCMEGICDYIIRDKGISRFHAKIIKREQFLYLLDLNSTNGTFLNGESLQGGIEYLLEEGDMVAFSQTEFYVGTES